MKLKEDGEDKCGSSGDDISNGNRGSGSGSGSKSGKLLARDSVVGRKGQTLDKG